ncbi:MauE/DoxX family redox-associated membrane protein [Pedobacter aquatilis]|uniref:MauE/DoxX family redox-associated membrane protein n=1 Tax=Pedobacter aquatilis TaxID=351343 RepID=UPI003977DA69
MATPFDISVKTFKRHQIKRNPVSIFANNAGLFLLLSLWFYTVVAKFADLKLFENQMQQMPFNDLVKLMITYTVPALEIITILLLILGKRFPGLILSLLLLLSFTIYITLVLSHFFPKTPCSCGGLISTMSWKMHFWFNLMFIVINVYCLIYIKRKGGSQAGRK